jgi:hypothetical protein
MASTLPVKMADDELEFVASGLGMGAAKAVHSSGRLASISPRIGAVSSAGLLWLDGVTVGRLGLANRSDMNTMASIKNPMA